jgi:glucosamine kinase
MLLLADSGSTKTEWKLVDDMGRIQVSLVSEGLNPYFFTEQEIVGVLETKILPRVPGVSQVFFYGAGCGLAPKAEQVKRAIDRVIPTAQGAGVAGDILAAARSLLQHHSGIACILGTGANSCVYSGEEIIEGVPSLGYMFSDWGSGTVMSRDFLALLLQERLPSAIQRDFSVTYQLSRVQILDSVYNKPSANKFMASFTPFILKYAEEPAIRQIILENFRNFYNYYVLRYKETRKLRNVSVVGSVAHHFRKYLIEAGETLDIHVDTILQHPMEGLIHFHCLRAKENAPV